MKKRIVFIVNPISGAQEKAVVLSQIERTINKSVFDYEIVKTIYAGHAREIAARAAGDGVDVVCAVGGDGTVNETASALVHTNTALAIIPCGSGNGFARHLHIPIDPVKAVDLINAGNVHDVDYGLVDGVPFFCVCGVGFDAHISMRFAEAGKRGPITYVESVVKNLTYSPREYELEIYRGGNVTKTTYRAFLISCANASQYGNNAYIAPQASVRDGMMDVTIMEPFNFFDASIMVLQLFNGTIDKNVRIKTFTCERLVITRKCEAPIHSDGEPRMAPKKVDVKIVGDGLKCVCPEGEGVRVFGDNIQAMWEEQISNIRIKSEQMLLSTKQTQRRIAQMNKTMLDKIKRK
jgi:YegS/Rv2252/BmrU family lipid kinase